MLLMREYGLPNITLKVINQAGVANERRLGRGRIARR